MGIDEQPKQDRESKDETTFDSNEAYNNESSDESKNIFVADHIEDLSESENNHSDGDGSIIKKKFNINEVRRFIIRASLVMVLLFSIIIPFQRSTLVAVGPGPLFQVEMRGESSTKPEVSADSWNFTTIAIRALSWGEVFWYQITGKSDLYPVSNRPSSGVAGAEMAAAKITAASVASSVLFGTGISADWLILEVSPDSPAFFAGLSIGERITLLNNKPINRFDTLKNALSSGPVELGLMSDSGSRIVKINVSKQGGILGVKLTPITSSEIIDGNVIATSDVGGGSAGLLFTLALIDFYSDGDLSGGMKISGTGTMEPDGSVGPILGIPYKFQAAKNGNSDVFFVPEGSEVEITERGNVKVVPVKNIVDAVKWLCDNGAAVVPICKYIG